MHSAISSSLYFYSDFVHPCTLFPSLIVCFLFYSRSLYLLLSAYMFFSLSLLYYLYTFLPCSSVTPSHRPSLILLSFPLLLLHSFASSLSPLFLFISLTFPSLCPSHFIMSFLSSSSIPRLLPFSLLYFPCSHISKDMCFEYGLWHRSVVPHCKYFEPILALRIAANCVHLCRRKIYLFLSTLRPSVMCLLLLYGTMV